MKMKPCRVTVDGVRYQVNSDGSVRVFADGAAVEPRVALDLEKAVRAEVQRLRRNRMARERSAAYRDCGVRRTAYGWE